MEWVVTIIILIGFAFTFSRLPGEDPGPKNKRY